MKNKHGLLERIKLVSSDPNKVKSLIKEGETYKSPHPATVRKWYRIANYSFSPVSENCSLLYSQVQSAPK